MLFLRNTVLAKALDSSETTSMSREVNCTREEEGTPYFRNVWYVRRSVNDLSMEVVPHTYGSHAAESGSIL